MILTDRTMTINDNTASLDSKVFLYRGDRNVELNFNIVNSKFRFTKNSNDNIIESSEAFYSIMKLVSPNGEEIVFPVTPIENGKAKWVIEGSLIDELDEVGEYDLQIRLLDSSQQSIITMPPLFGQVVVSEPLFGDVNAVTGLDTTGKARTSVLSSEQRPTLNEDGTYNKKEWVKQEIIYETDLNTLEDISDKNRDSIIDLDGRLEKIETLQEGNELEVSTDTGYVRVEDTKDGYMKDLCVEGNTWINLNRQELYGGISSATNTFVQSSTNRSYVADVVAGKTYTIIKQEITDRFIVGFADSAEFNATVTIAYNNPSQTITKVTATNSKLIVFVDVSSTSRKVLILEGDHTQNPPSYFEGLKSVGDGVDKIEVLSHGKNLFDKPLELGAIGATGIEYSSSSDTRTQFIKVNPNTQYTTSVNGVLKNTNLFYYDKNKNFISSGGVVSKFTTPNNCYYVRHYWGGTDLTLKFQIEYGTVATPYEPYKQDKKPLLFKNSEGEFEAISSLRKVSDSVKDTIELHSDGKYYFHKRCGEVIFDGSSDESWSLSKINTNTNRFSIDLPNVLTNTLVYVCDKFNNTTEIASEVEGCIIKSQFSIFVLKSKLTSQDVTGFKTWLSQNPVTVVYQLANEEIYEVNGIDLNSYNGETSVWCESGVISPSKLSFKATSHISNIVTKMKSDVDKNTKFREELTESLTLTKEFESGYEVIEDTKEGSVSIESIEGKTLVNLVNYSSLVTGGGATGNFTKSNNYIKATLTSSGSKVAYLNTFYDISDKLVTVIIDNKSTISSCILYSRANFTSLKPLQTGLNIFVLTASNLTNGIAIGNVGTLNSGDVVEFSITILEGDFTHTANPPSFFEGLKSVGDLEELEVMSRKEDGNLFDGLLEIGALKSTDGSEDNASTSWRRSGFMNVLKQNILLNVEETGTKYIFQYDKNKKFIKFNSSSSNVSSISLDSNCRYIRTAYNFVPTQPIQLRYESSPVDVYSYKGNKKPILYQTSSGVYEKVVLRSVGGVADTIERHSDGKYYFHKRCGEKVFTGSENWLSSGLSQTNVYTCYFGIGGIKSLVNISTLPTKPDMTVDSEGVTTHTNGNIYISVLKTKLTPQDVTGFKTWISNNPVTVVYQLATEEVYEVVNLDLDSYEGETSIILNSTIPAKVVAKLQSNLIEVVDSLKGRIKYLETKFTNMFKAVLCGDVQSLAYELYPEDFPNGDFPNGDFETTQDGEEI